MLISGARGKSKLWENQGIQVVVTAYNTSEYLERCFRGIENSLKGRKWILVFSNDGSTDDTLERAVFLSRNFKSHIVNNPKAKNVSEAKNKNLELTHRFKEEYPAVMMMDSDDEMLPDRVKLLDCLVETNGLFAVGDYNLIIDGTVNEIVLGKFHDFMRFPPSATLFHQSLIKEGEKFFDENFQVYSDIVKWWTLRCIENIEILRVSGFFVLNYFIRKGSVSFAPTEENLRMVKDHIMRVSLLKKY